MHFASALSYVHCPLSLRPDVIELCQRMVLSCRRALTSPNLFFPAVTSYLFSVTNAFFKLLYRCARLSLFFTCNDRVSNPHRFLHPPLQVAVNNWSAIPQHVSHSACLPFTFMLPSPAYIFSLFQFLFLQVRDGIHTFLAQAVLEKWQQASFVSQPRIELTSSSNVTVEVASFLTFNCAIISTPPPCAAQQQRPRP
jgi:hypothetical protein